MRTATAKTIAQAVARRLGRMPDSTDGMPDEDLASHLAYANEALPTVWEWAAWPELTRLQPRRLEAEEDTGALAIYHEAGDWSETATYKEGDCVWHEGRTWRATAESLDEEPAAGDYWEVYREWRPVGKMLRALTAARGGTELEIEPGDGLTYVSGEGAAEDAIVWAEFRLPVPELVSTPWDAEIEYARGDRRYYQASATSEGRVWESLQNGNTGKIPGATGNSLWWEETEVPAEFLPAVAALAASNAFFSDERLGEGGRWEDKGMDQLALLRARKLGAGAGGAIYRAVV